MLQPSPPSPPVIPSLHPKSEKGESELIKLSPKRTETIATDEDKEGANTDRRCSRTPKRRLPTSTPPSRGRRPPSPSPGILSLSIISSTSSPTSSPCKRARLGPCKREGEGAPPQTSPSPSGSPMSAAVFSMAAQGELRKALFSFLSLCPPSLLHSSSLSSLWLSSLILCCSILNVPAEERELAPPPPCHQREPSTLYSRIWFRMSIAF
mmetsp:Transcript_21211/g.42139  ORF Transcript_21211/g.42139 Transcript_21211/m.42139 type:complete len:209 (-) Transcript_21211:762-1388(-)